MAYMTSPDPGPSRAGGAGLQALRSPRVTVWGGVGAALSGSAVVA